MEVLLKNLKNKTCKDPTKRTKMKSSQTWPQKNVNPNERIILY
jgi:hypothetical protein